MKTTIMNTTINTRALFGWLITFLAFPIGGGIATLIIGKLDSPLQGVMGGVVAGLTLGLFEWLALRRVIPISPAWIIATAGALAVGVGTGIAVIGTANTTEAILLRAIPTAILLASVQTILLRSFSPRALVWLPVVAILYPVAWWITVQVIGANVNQGFIVFGASGALVFKGLTGLALWWIIRGRFVKPPNY